MGLSGWSYYSKVPIDNTGNSNALTDYQVKVSLTSSNFDFTKANSDGSDIRFTDSDQSTLLSYWIENYDSSGQTATIWVKVPSIPASATKDIYLYFGNSSATSASDIDNTFIFGDDFEGTSLDTNKWEVYGTGGGTGGTITVSTDHSKFGTQSAKIDDTSTDYGIAMRTVPFGNLGLTGKFINEYWLYQDGNGGSEAPPLAYYQSDGTQAIWHNIYSEDYAYYDTDYRKYLAIIKSQWVKFKVIPDASTGKFDVYVNGTLEVSGGNFRNSVSAIDYLDTMGWQGQTYTSYIDGVRIRKYASPEPTTSVGVLRTNSNTLWLGTNF